MTTLTHTFYSLSTHVKLPFYSTPAAGTIMYVVERISPTSVVKRLKEGVAPNFHDGGENLKICFSTY